MSSSSSSSTTVRSKKELYYNMSSSSSSSSTTVRSPPPHPVPYYLINQHAHFLTRDNQDEWQLARSFAVRFVVYVALIVVIMIVVSVMMKLMKDCDDIGEVTAAETNPLIPKEEETASLTYGACDEQDLESGNGSCSCSCSWSEDLYDAKICVICYDHSRDCFFVPCGHCATCYACAQRIIDGEIKNCPICRRLIHKVRKLFTSY